MKITIVCHGNIARSQVLHHYVEKFAAESGVDLDVYSCGTAPIDIYPNPEELLADVEEELSRRGLHAKVARNILDEETRKHLHRSDYILVADHKRKADLLGFLDGNEAVRRIRLFYEFIGEDAKDFVDTYDAEAGTQNTERYESCFDELERIARKVVLTVGAGSE